MKHLKLFESFESSQDIESICKKYKIKKWSINPYGLVDVDGDVIFPSFESNISKALNGLEKLPLKFGKVTGHFNCSNQKLTTLEGSPIYVGGNFNFTNNRIISLEGSPIYVGGNFNCEDNRIISLEGFPRVVDGSFSCRYNPIHSVYKLFPNHKSFVESLDYNYLRGRNIDKRRFQEALEELNMSVPNKIEGYNYI